MDTIAQVIKTIAATPGEMYSVVAKVLAIDDSTRTCEVEPLNGDAKIFDVRLQAEQSIEYGLVIVPAVGSWVIVTFTGINDGYVAMCSRVDKILCVIDGQSVEFTKDGLKWDSSQANMAEQVASLMDTLDALLTTLSTFQVATNVGPSISVMPQVITSIEQHRVAFSQIKQKLSTILY